MKYFFLSLFSLILSVSSFAYGPIKGSNKVCTGDTTRLSVDTTGGTWSSSAAFIASVGTSGLVTGIATGTTIITYNAGGILALRTITVNPITSVIGNTTVCAGLTTMLSNSTLGGRWTSSNPALATVGTTIGIATVVTIAPGTDTIFYTLPTGCIATATITINADPAPITGNINICVLQTSTLTDATYNGTWTSSLPATAKVGGITGIVLGQAPGIAIITYTIPTGCISSTTVTVNALPAPITGSAEAFHGNSTILADLTGGGTWSSSNPSYVTITPGGGVATGIMSGDAYIYYTLTTTGCYVSRKFLVDPLPDSGATFPITAWYPFCDDTTDHSGNKQNLTEHGVIDPNGGFFAPPTPVADRFTYPNAAYSFSALGGGGNGDILVHSPAFSIATPSGDFTYSCWIKPTPGSGISSGISGWVNQSSIIMYNGNPNADGLGFVMNNGSLGLGNVGNLVGIEIAGAGLYLPTQIVTPGVNGWHQLLLMKSTTTFFFFIDGVSEGFFTIPPINAPSGDFAIGNDYTGTSPSGAFQGAIDDVALFNEALDSLQRVDLYNFNPDQPSFTLGRDTAICSYSFRLAPVPQTFGSFYTWSTGDSVDTALTVVPSPVGLSNYELSITRPYACTATDDINISEKPLPIHLGNDTNICINDTIVLNATYTSATYLWNTGAITPTLKVFATGTYWVDVDSGICFGTDTINVTGWRTPLVDLGPDVSNCTGAPFEVHNAYPDILYDAGYTYLWSNGAATDSLLTTTSGTFWLQVSNHGCPQSDTMTVLIVFDTFSFHSRDTAICQGKFVTASATFNSIVSYQWTPTTGVPLSTVPSPNITPDTSATYILTGRYPGCPDIVDSFHIDVQPYPMVNIGGNRQVCSYDTLHIDAQVTPSWYAHYNYSWSPGTYLDDSTAQDVVFLAGDSTDLVLNVSTSAGCKGSDSALIIVHPGGFDSFIANLNLCPHDTLKLGTIRKTIGNTLGTLASYEWHPGIFFSDSTVDSPFLYPINSGEYSVIGTSTFGCIDSLHFSVVVNPGAVIYLGDSVILHPGQFYQISPQTNCTYFHWFPDYGMSLGDTDIANPIVSPGLSTRYIVHASTEAGCSVTDSIDIYIDPKSLLAIPNAFTPGAGINNILYIIKDGLATLNYFRIYDRWGVKVFESTNIDMGWDGTFNGSPQPFGVYVYEAQATTNAGFVFQQKGNITLIR